MSRGLVLAALAMMMLGGGLAVALADTIRVTIDRLVFAPVEINAKVGDTIEWVNNDAFAHTATVKGGWEVMIPPKATATMVVEKAEQAAFFCRFHPNMKGRLTATER
jgi:plastocyanin